MNALAGKVAFVTGASGGIGGATCRRFLREGAGVAAIDIDPDTAANELQDEVTDGRAVVLGCDVGDPDDVRQTIQRTVHAFGALDILINVAGGSTDADDAVTEAPEEEFWRVIRLDLFGTFLVCKYGIPELVRSGGGSVINLTSVLALMAAPRRDCYTAAKGGVASMTRSIAAGYANERVRVNAIAPGVVLTPRVQAMYDQHQSARELVSRHLLGPCVPEDIAAMALFLASDESCHITGQILQVDSGVTIH